MESGTVPRPPPGPATPRTASPIPRGLADPVACYGPVVRERLTVVLVLAAMTVLFVLPAFEVPGGIASGDPYRDNDWLNCRVFDRIARQSLLEDGQFPLRTHLLGGGFPIVAHPSDGSWAPTLPAVLLFGDVTGVKVNIAIVLLLGALAMTGLARRWLGLSPLASLFCGALLLVSGWLPSMLLVGFYPQLFYLLTPLVILGLFADGDYLVACAPADRPWWRVFPPLAGASLPLFLILQQGGLAFPAVVFFLAVAAWLAGAGRWLAAEPNPPTAPPHPPRGWALPLGFPTALLGTLAAIRLVQTTDLPNQLGVVVAAVGGCSIWVWVRRSAALQSLLRTARPELVRALVILGLALILGAGRLAGLATLGATVDYSHSLNRPAEAWWFQDSWAEGTLADPEEEDVGAGDDPSEDLYTERFYETLPRFLEALVERAPDDASYQMENGRLGEPSTREYSWLGLTWPPLLLALLGLSLLRGRARPQQVALWTGIFSAICFGWNLPLDMQFVLTGGLPLLGDLAQPVKYWNFFVLLGLVLLAGVGADGLVARMAGGNLKRLAWALIGLTLLVPATQNRSAFRQLFAEPRTAEPDEGAFRQVLLIDEEATLSGSAEGVRAVASSAAVQEHRRPGLATEFLNVPRGVGTINWYGSFAAPEVAIPAEFATLAGERIANRDYRGEAWIEGAGGSVRALAIRPNTIEVSVSVDGPSRVVINQSHLRGFRTDTGRLVAADGLLGVELDAAGDHDIRLVYRPVLILAGLAVSALSMLGVLVALLVAWRMRRGRLAYARGPTRSTLSSEDR